jgi:Tfp pilus assembly protein PilN
MKLNLLPTYVGKERAVRSAIFLSFAIAAASIVAAVFMITSSRKAVQDSENEISQWQAQAQAAVAESKRADVIVQNARILILNTNLAQAMDKHNYDYIGLYDEVRRYIPGFFRVTTMSAQPAGEQAVVTLTGVIRTHQQYADLMLALLRIPGATSVTRSNYQIVDPYVPPLSEGSQSGAPIRPGEAPLPDDPLDRLDRMIAEAGTEGFLGTGNFGVNDPTQPKGAMPGWSLITVSVVVPKNIQTPNPRATLATVGGGGAQQPGGVPGPGGPPGPPGPQGAPSRASGMIDEPGR